MQKEVKSLAFMMIMMLMIFSLIGCSSTTSSSNKENKANIKTTEVKKNQENNASAANQIKAQIPPEKTQNQATASTTAAKTDSNTNTGTQAKAHANTSIPAPAASNSNRAKPTANNQSPVVQHNPVSPSKPATQARVQTAKLIIIGPKEQSNINRSLTVPIKDGDTALNVLLTGIGGQNVDYSGSGATAYVRGIENVYEFDYGQKSGWTVSLNGTRLTRSAGTITVKANDKIEWVYTEDYTVNN